jgi:nitrite reductase/ring-hydroxylating ferredoxin subunit
MAFLQPLVKRIEHMKVLDTVAVPVAAAVQRAVKPRRVRNLLSGTALGHPAHPTLTDVPIGAWTMAALLDTVGGRRAAPAAGLLTAVGIAAALPTAATGLNDWSDTQEEPSPRRVGVVHAAANTVALGLYIASLVARCQGRHCRGRLLGFGGFGAVVAGAYLGGHLAFTNAVNVNHTATEERPLDWTAVLPDGDLAEGEFRKVPAGNTTVLLGRLRGRILALSSTCSHMGGPLEEGQVEDGCVSCPWHGSTFDLSDGHVVRGPATAPQPAYETRVRESRIEVRARD